MDSEIMKIEVDTPSNFATTRWWFTLIGYLKGATTNYHQLIIYLKEGCDRCWLIPLLISSWLVHSLLSMIGWLISTVGWWLNPWFWAWTWAQQKPPWSIINQYQASCLAWWIMMNHHASHNLAIICCHQSWFLHYSAITFPLSNHSQTSTSQCASHCVAVIQHRPLLTITMISHSQS